MERRGKKKSETPEKMPRYFLFWIKSCKGTNSKMIFQIPNNWDEKDIQTALERWCSNFGAWEKSENVVSYGYKSIKVLNKKELEKKYGRVCKRKAKITEEWQILAAMFNVRKLN